MNFLKKHAFWMAPIVALFGFISYFTYFYQFPVLRDFPWVNFPLIILAVLLAVWALFSMWRSSGVVRKAIGVVSSLLCVSVLVFFSFYIFSYSYKMPVAAKLGSVKSIPQLSLRSATGNMVSVEPSGPDRKLLISFYRGTW